MTWEIIVFVSAILVGAILFWRESKNNQFYRYVNKLTHSKKLQMKPDDKKGFFYKQSFFGRLVYIIIFYLIIFSALTILIPFSVFTFQIFIASVVGTTIGTFIASLIFATQDKIEDGEEFIEGAIEKGKDFIDDIIHDDDPEKELEKEQSKDTEPEKETKSARDRLKEEGLL